MAKGSLGKITAYYDEIDLGFIDVLNERFNNLLITDSTEVNVRYMSNSLQNSFRQRDRMLRNLGPDTPGSPRPNPSSRAAWSLGLPSTLGR